jgi:hypothetical protein
MRSWRIEPEHRLVALLAPERHLAVLDVLRGWAEHVRLVAFLAHRVPRHRGRAGVR